MEIGSPYNILSMGVGKNCRISPDTILPRFCVVYVQATAYRATTIYQIPLIEFNFIAEVSWLMVKSCQFQEA